MSDLSRRFSSRPVARHNAAKVIAQLEQEVDSLVQGAPGDLVGSEHSVRQMAVYKQKEALVAALKRLYE